MEVETQQAQEETQVEKESAAEPMLDVQDPVEV